MKTPDHPDNEAERLRAMAALRIDYTQHEERFDGYTRLARTLCGVPISAITFLDRDTQWFKSCTGADMVSTPRSVSFCGHAILQQGVFYIPDALADPRFADNPLVLSGPCIRFYAGAPLWLPDGMAVGSLCVIDVEPRTLSLEQMQGLRELADCVQQELGRVVEESRARALLAEAP